MPTNAEKLVVRSSTCRDIHGYADFCCLVQKGAVVTLAISGVTGLIFMIFAHDVAKILPLNIFESELSYSNPFRNASCQMKVILPIFAKNWLPWQRHLKNEKRNPDGSSTNKYLSFGEKITKIGPWILR